MGEVEAQPPLTQPTSSPENNSRWQWVERVSGSRHLKKAPQLHAILIYLCQKAIADPAAGIHEYEIGCSALGRKPSFNPNEDNIVRVQISHLRKKLEAYYAAEGKDDAVRIAIPRGSYVPQFEERLEPNLELLAAPQPETDSPLPSSPAPPIARRGLVQAAGLVLLGGALGSSIAMLVESRRVKKPAVDPILLEAWRPMTRPDSNVLLSVATPLHMVVGPKGHQIAGSSEYPAPPEAYPLFRKHRPLAADHKLGMSFIDNSLGVGIMNAAIAAVNTLRSMGVSYQILPEHVATISALRGRNAILFGAPVDSEAISRTMEKTPLVVDFEPSVREFVIRDRKTGAMIVPSKNSSGEFNDVYGLITVLNTRESDRGPVGLIIFSGITSAGVQGAAEFFASPQSLKDLKSIFAGEGFKTFPPAYQVVVRCTFGDMLLLAYEYYSHRILPADN